MGPGRVRQLDSRVQQLLRHTRVDSGLPGDLAEPFSPLLEVTQEQMSAGVGRVFHTDGLDPPENEQGSLLDELRVQGVQS